MEEIRGKTLKEWKDYCKSDNVPIKTMKYITCLEERIEALTIPVVSKRSLSDIEIEYKHPTGKVKGKLKYDDDEETLILDYKGGFITLPNIEDCNVC